MEKEELRQIEQLIPSASVERLKALQEMIETELKTRKAIKETVSEVKSPNVVLYSAFTELKEDYETIMEGIAMMKKDLKQIYAEENEQATPNENESERMKQTALILQLGEDVETTAKELRKNYGIDEVYKRNDYGLDGLYSRFPDFENPDVNKQTANKIANFLSYINSFTFHFDAVAENHLKAIKQKDRSLFKLKEADFRSMQVDLTNLLNKKDNLEAFLSRFHSLAE